MHSSGSMTRYVSASLNASTGQTATQSWYLWSTQALVTTCVMSRRVHRTHLNPLSDFFPVRQYRMGSESDYFSTNGNPEVIPFSTSRLEWEFDAKPRSVIESGWRMNANHFPASSWMPIHPRFSAMAMDALRSSRAMSIGDWVG